MRFTVFLFAWLAASGAAMCQPPVPTASAQTKVPLGLEGLVWNKWDTDHFVVLSLDRSRGSAMRRDAESVRQDVLSRWSISDGNPVRCKLVFVPDAQMLKRLFGLSVPRCEVRRSEGGSVESAAIWVDEERIALLSSLISECELACGDFKPFARRGIPILEKSPAGVREDLLSSTDAPPADLAAKTKSGVDDATLARNSALACLMIRREFGRAAFGSAIRGSAPPPNEVLGFSSEQEFEETYKRYRTNLLGDIKDGRTPDEYLGAAR